MGCHLVMTQLLVNTKEVDLDNSHFLLIYPHGSRDCSNKANQLLVTNTTDAQMPILAISRRLQGPQKERNRVVEAKHVIVVFNVILLQEIVDFHDLFFVIDVDVFPNEIVAE